MGYAPVAYRQERKGLCCRGLECPWSNCSRIKSNRNYFPRYAVHWRVIARYAVLGLFSLGLFALGILSAGCFSIGVFATGAISLGIISIGAIAIGDFSVGALSIGKYFALGDNARAMIAIGDSQAVGSVFQKSSEMISQNITVRTLTEADITTVKNLLDTTVPSYLSWAKEIIKLFL